MLPADPGPGVAQLKGSGRKGGCQAGSALVGTICLVCHLSIYFLLRLELRFLPQSDPSFGDSFPILPKALHFLTLSPWQFRNEHKCSERPRDAWTVDRKPHPAQPYPGSGKKLPHGERHQPQKPHPYLRPG